MAKYIDDLGYSKRNTFLSARDERMVLREEQMATEQTDLGCLAPGEIGSENRNFFPENPILALVSQLANSNPTRIYWTNSAATPQDFVLFNANVNFNVPKGGFVLGTDDGQSNDYQTWTGAGWTGTEPPFNPDRYVSRAAGRVLPKIGSGPSYQEIQYETIENPMTINTLFFEGSTLGVLLKTEVEIKYRDGNGNFQLDHKKLVMNPYARTGNLTLDSPITTMIDGFASITIKALPPGSGITATIYPGKQIEPVDCIGGNAEAMLI